MQKVVNSQRQNIDKIWAWLRLRKWRVTGAFGMGIVLISIAPLYTVSAAHGEVYSIAAVPKHDVAIVFGAGVYPDGTPTPFLESRLIAGVALYKSGKVKVLVMSGDNRTTHYNEPAAMKRFAIAKGVPANAVVLDYAGYDTYDTCYRVHSLFGVDSAILVTHAYHLPRALLTCNKLGIKSVGVKADRVGSSFSKNYLFREVLSINKSTLELIFKPKPGVLGPKVDTVRAALSQNK